MTFNNSHRQIVASPERMPARLRERLHAQARAMLRAWARDRPSSPIRRRIVETMLGNEQDRTGPA